MCLCKHVKHLSVLCSSTAVISAHPIHSLDNPHHHFHSSSLASPARSHLYHPSSPWPIGTSMSLSDRANSTGERWGSSPDGESIPGVGKWNGEGLAYLQVFSVSCLSWHFCDGFKFVFFLTYCTFLPEFKYSVQGAILVKSSNNLNCISFCSSYKPHTLTLLPFLNPPPVLFYKLKGKFIQSGLSKPVVAFVSVTEVLDSHGRCRLLPCGPE